MIKGYLDIVGEDYVSGWAYNDKDCTQVVVVLLIDHKIIKEVKASNYREDLFDIGLGMGTFGFKINIPLNFLDGKVHKISIIEKHSKENLQNSPQQKILLEQLYWNLMKLDKQYEKYKDKIFISNVFSRKNIFKNDKVILLATYIKDGKLKNNHILSINSFKSLDYKIILINNTTKNSDKFISNSSNYCDFLITKKNNSRDFGSWIGFLLKYYYIIKDLDHCIFINESILGPLSSIEKTIDTFKESNVDFWSLSDSWQNVYHLQSSLFILTNKAINSKYFINFLINYDFPDKKEDVIKKGELALSQFLIPNISHSVLCPYREVTEEWIKKYIELKNNLFKNYNLKYIRHYEIWCDNIFSNIMEGIPLNPQHIFYSILISKFNYPYVKKELLIHNPEKIPMLGEIYQLPNKDYIPVLETLINEALLYEANNKSPYCSLNNLVLL